MRVLPTIAAALLGAVAFLALPSPQDYPTKPITWWCRSRQAAATMRWPAMSPRK